MREMRVEIGDTDLQRHGIMREICNRLGLSNTLDADTVVSVKKFEDLSGWTELLKRAYQVFNKRDRSSADGVLDLKSLIKRLNSMLREWSDVTLDPHEVRRKLPVNYKVAFGDFAKLFVG